MCFKRNSFDKPQNTDERDVKNEYFRSYEKMPSVL